MKVRLFGMLGASLLLWSCAHRAPTAAANTPPLPSGREHEAETDVHAPWDRPSDRGALQEYLRSQRLALKRLDEARTLLGTSHSDTTSATTNPQTWTFIGPQPIGTGSNPYAGSILNIAIDPHAPATVYVGTYVGKLWKTTNSGGTWIPLSDSGPLVEVQWIAIDPVLLNTLYVLDAGSLYKSADGGSTWAALPPVLVNSNCSGEAFAIHPNVSGTWIVSEYCTGSPNSSVIYKTTDAGSSWSMVATVAGEIDTIAFNALTPNYAYAAGFNGSAVLFETSTDVGTTWASAIGSGSTGLAQLSTYAPSKVAFASAPSNPQTIYLQVDSTANPDLISMFKTVNAGSAWAALSFPQTDQNPRLPGVVAVDPANENTVFSGAIDLYRSTDGGATWQSAMAGSTSTPLHVDNHAMVFTPDGNTAYESNDGGIWTSGSFRSSSVKWTPLNQTFGTAEFYSPFAMDPTTPNRAFGGLQDNNTIIYSGSLAWQETGTEGDGLGTAVNPINLNIVYALTTAGGIYESTAGGAAGTFSLLSNTPITGGKILMDLSTPSNLYAYQDTNLFQTLNGAATWRPFGPPFTSDIDSVAVAPSSSDTVAVMQGGLSPWLTNNAQSAAPAWTPGLGVKNIVTSTTFQKILIDPANPNKLSALLGNGSLAAPMAVSTDGGMSWQARDLGPNIVDTPTDLLIDPDLPDTMYLGTRSSVFRSTDGGATWYPLASGFPVIETTSVNLHRAARILRVATTGRGVWDLAVPLTAPLMSNVSIAASGSGYGVTVNGNNFTPASEIVINGSAVPTTYVNPQQLEASVASSSIAPSTVYYVAVSSPGSGGGLSNPLIASVGPTIFPGGVQNAAGPVSVTNDSPTNSFGVGLAPGTFTALYGSQLASSTTVASYPLPATLGGVKVMVNGIAAPIYFVSQGQIDFVIPWETPGTEAIIQVVAASAVSNTVTASLQPAPQIFTTNQGGSGQGAVLIADTSTLVAPAGAFPGSAPVPKGQYVSIYATGLGAVNNAPSDGGAATGLSQTVVQPTVNIGCLTSSGLLSFCNAPVLFSGLAPGFVGLYQLNVQIPATAMSGSAVPLQITLPSTAGRPSNIVTIAVQ